MPLTGSIHNLNMHKSLVPQKASKKEQLGGMTDIHSWKYAEDNV